MKRPLLVVGVAAAFGFLGSAAMSITAGAQPTSIASVKPKVQVDAATLAIARSRAPLAPDVKLRILRASPGFGQMTATNLESSFKLSTAAPIVRQGSSIMAHLGFTNAVTVVSSVEFDAATDLATFNGNGLVRLNFKGAANRGYLVDCNVQANVMGYEVYAGNTSLTSGHVTVNANHASFVIPKQTTANEIMAVVRGTPPPNGTWSFFDCELTAIN